MFFMESKMELFFRISELLNSLGIVPMLFGSMGLEHRLNVDLNVQDLDVSILKSDFIKNKYKIRKLMLDSGYELLQESNMSLTFYIDGIEVEFYYFDKDECGNILIDVKSLSDIAVLSLNGVEVFHKGSVSYMLPSLPDYLKIYTAFSKSLIRKQMGKCDKDLQKIRLIQEALNS